MSCDETPAVLCRLFRMVRIAAQTFLLFAGMLSALSAAPLIYNRDVRPILSEKCFSCHGFDEKSRKAELRLDVAAEAYVTKDGVTPIKPKDPEKSAVWQRIVSPDEDEVMPPPKSHITLSDQEKATLKKWIEEGATYQDHWAFIPPVKSPLPEGGKNAVDAFVRDHLKKEGLRPNDPASKEMLIRRLSLDLLGLPPSAQEVAAFVADSEPKSYERLVDRLLASPHFGERMAMDWMDAARYADTNGFSIDGGRHLWLWRDYVINAFNTNKPYDSFLIEQLAGDLLPNATDEQKIASGFQRNNMVTHEGGTISEENLTNYNADRVKTLGEAVMGLTLACAQCHNHKYDPITAKDYYQLFAYFNTLGDRGLDGDGGVNAGPALSMKTVLQQPAEEKALQAEISRLEAVLAAPSADLIKAWESVQWAQEASRGLHFKTTPTKALKISTPNRGAGFEIEDECFAVIKQAAGFAAFDVSLSLPKLDQPMTGVRIAFHPDAALPGGGWGYGTGGDGKGTFIVTNVSLSADQVPSDQVNLYRVTEIGRVTASSWHKDWRPEGIIDTAKETGWRPSGSETGPVFLTVTFKEPIDTQKTTHLTVQVNFGHGGNMMAKKMEFLAFSGKADDFDLPPTIREVIAKPSAERSAEQHKALADYVAKQAPALERTRVALSNAKDRLAALTQPQTTMVMAVAEKPRETFILNRGDYTQPTTKVTAGTPDFLPTLDGVDMSSRLGLAKWLTMRNHPLTARVAVNRWWQQLLGTGIVASVADFGSQGQWPTHPELLDWLAVELMDSGWNVKALIKQIVLSETYRQDSRASAEQLEKDPGNRLLARGPRFRFSAEMVRDSMLKISSLLVPQLGGPSVNPYAPGDLWREVSHYGSTPATAQTFIQDHGDKLYRRSLYTYWKRTMPPPNMSAFDAPNREVCTATRTPTNTPLQSLVLLNDPQFVEAARVFAQRMIEHSSDDAARLDWACREALSRPISPQERQRLLAALTRERQVYAHDNAAAQALLSTGESLRNEVIPAAEHAAWTQVASLLLNLSETITRN